MAEPTGGGAVVFIILLATVALGLRGRKKRPRGSRQPGAVNLKGSGKFEVEVVGESHYQNSLRAIVGDVSTYREFSCTAELICEDNNPYDSNAVAVLVDGRQVGHLSRIVAVVYRQKLADAGVSKATATCRAKIFGGGKRKPSLGVWLDI